MTPVTDIRADEFNYEKEQDDISGEIEIVQEWVSVPGYANYEANRTGAVRNTKTKQVLVPYPKECGYLRVRLYDEEGERKSCYVHQLVAKTFIPNPENKLTVNHINHKKGDNRAENLEWLTTAEQNRHKRKKAAQEHYTQSSRAVWKCDAKTGAKIELFASIKLASIAVKGDDTGKSKITAVAQGKSDKKGHTKWTAYGFKWIYDDLTNEAEVWKAVDPELTRGVQGYFVSNQGRIKNHKGRIGDAFVGTCGYSWFSVAKHRYQAHVLIAKTFLPNPDSKPTVNHIDGVKTNNVLDNLEWSTQSENNQHAHDTRLNKSARAVCQISTTTLEVIKTFPSAKSASKDTGVGESGIGNVAKNKQKTAGGFYWKYDV